MKSISFIIIACLCLLYGCKEEVVGQYPVDSTPPQMVSNVVVTNLPGKVSITYQLPNEPDLLYVKAVYTDALGHPQEVKASVFNNKLEISGFGRKIKRTISLISVDRSRNESGPVYVEIEPEDSPIYTAVAQLKVRPSWSGLVLNWENPTREQFIVRVLKMDQDNKFTEIDTFYSTEESAQRSVRGQEPKPSTFGFVIQDVYGNTSDTVQVNLTPYYEIEIPSNLFTALPLAPGYKFRKAQGNITCLWDGIHGDGTKLLYIAAGGAPNPYFTIDLGKEYLMSRMKMWQRANADYQFQLHCPHIFEIWGTSDPMAAADPSNWEGWTKLALFESIRPSGLGPDVKPTPEDLEYANAGEEFEFPNDIIPIRYFRFRSVENWGKSTGLHFDELKLWGKEATEEDGEDGEGEVGGEGNEGDE
ncbi:DUF5000 domain-containing lipoprotein [Gallalistipes aquisgranensis]|uniref:DUF5000 domain-containing lipoprotein n=1 Tax=Gallalistipes aquisgranensis TaxID=2779358 RepID=UPI001CF8BDDE|nr:DUF5000 domain-containing lipoprotein [Gallalistipes aquisgranensis]MBE5032783.1 DUF4959 domain-containing protein [Gallalistipes aquisgranensis]